MKQYPKQIKIIGWAIIAITGTMVLADPIITSYLIAEQYVSASAGYRESCKYALAQNGINQRSLINPFRGK